MDYVEDPVLRDIRREFLDEVASIHAQHGHTDDWAALAVALGLRVKGGARSMYASRGEADIIFLDNSEFGPRRNYSFAHEIAHHLFRATDSAFQAVLADTYKDAPKSLLYEMEEALCHEAAALLIFPAHLVRVTLLKLGATPEAVIDLATTRRASLAVAIIRLVSGLDANAWGYVVNRDNLAEFTWTNTRYRPGMGTLIDAQHPMHAAREAPVELRAQLPFKASRKRWPVVMRAAAHGDRLVALFADKFPPTPSDEQPTLFAQVAEIPSPAAD